MAALFDRLLCSYPLAGDANADVGALGALTAVNSPTFADVPTVGTMSAHVAASNQKRTLASSASWNFEAASYCLFATWRPTTIGANYDILSKWNATGDQRGFRLRQLSTNRFQFQTHDKTTNASSVGPITLSIGPFAVAGTIYDIFAGVDYESGVAFIEVDGQFVTVPLSGHVSKHVTESFCVGGLTSTATAAANGNIGRVAVWTNYIPTLRERNWIRRAQLISSSRRFIAPRNLLTMGCS